MSTCSFSLVTLSVILYGVEYLVHLELSAVSKDRPIVTCEDCGKRHREIFRFSNADQGRAQAENAIKKWGDFLGSFTP